MRMKNDVHASELHRTQVNLEGLLEVLGKNLYSSPIVAVRELIQNSHDACIRRRIESGDDFEAKIHLRTFVDKNELHIEDNGAGLSKSEIVQYLATIGSGYTRQLRDQTQSVDMIGYYGLGFLTAYVVASKVEVYTCSYHDPDQSWKFVSNDGQRFSIEKTDDRAIGSKVVLVLADEFQQLANAEILAVVLKRYCSLLQIKIFLNNDKQAINHLLPPWRLQVEQVSALRLRRARLEFASLFEKTFEPICTIAITGNEEYDFQGLIWIHDGASYATSDNRSVTVFIRDMFITDKAQDLLPHWAGFASAVIESNKLLPTASREEVQQDSAYTQIQAIIYQQLIDGLIRLVDSEPETFSRILYRHNEHLLGAAISDPRLFAALADKLKLPSSEGDLLIPELLRHSNRCLNITMEEQGGYELILSRAVKVPVVYGFRFAVYPFCKQYAEINNIKLAILGTQQGNAQLFSKTTLPEDKMIRLQQLLAREGEQVIAAEFSPDYIPMIMVADEDVLLKKRIEQDQANKRISMAALSLARAYTEKINDQVQAYIYVNTRSELVEQLLQANDYVQQHLAVMLRAFMLSMSGNDQSRVAFSLSQELKNYSASLISLLNKMDHQ